MWNVSWPKILHSVRHTSKERGSKRKKNTQKTTRSLSHTNKFRSGRRKLGLLNWGKSCWSAMYFAGHFPSGPQKPEVWRPPPKWLVSSFVCSMNGQDWGSGHFGSLGWWLRPDSSVPHLQPSVLAVFLLPLEMSENDWSGVLVCQMLLMATFFR